MYSNEAILNINHMFRVKKGTFLWIWNFEILLYNPKITVFKCS